MQWLLEMPSVVLIERCSAWASTRARCLGRVFDRLKITIGVSQHPLHLAGCLARPNRSFLRTPQ